MSARTAAREPWYASFDQFYSGTHRWETADAMLAFPDDPTHQQDMPAFEKSQERLSRFAELLNSEAGAGVDIDAELDALEADLQAIIGGDERAP
jgi:hypothetical protein